jgi:pilus assembly protein CpaE
VLLGSNKLFIVSETTVPALRHAKQLVAAIKERLGDGAKPQVIVNRFQQRMFSGCAADLEQTLGRPVSAIPNDYGLCARRSTAACRWRGQAGQQITAPKKLIVPQVAGARRRQIGHRQETRSRMGKVNRPNRVK